MSPRPLLRPGSLASRIWLRYSDNLPAVLSLVLLLGLFLIAAFAPFLSQDRPIYMDGSSPLLASFSNLDWFWLGLATSSIVAAITWHLRAGKSNCAVLVVGFATLTMALFLLITANSHPVHERRRYRVEEEERAQLAQLDQEIRNRNLGPKRAVELERSFVEDSGQSQIVALEVFERLAFIEQGKFETGAYEELVNHNESELTSLQNAIYPINRFDPNLPGFLILRGPYQGPHTWGSDGQGRDVLARLIHGTRTALTVALCATLLIAILGLVFGLCSGYFGGIVDRSLTRLTELVLCLPVLAIMVAAPAWFPREWRRSPFFLVAFLGLTLWPQAARLVRGEVRRCRQLDYVRSAIALGLKNHQVLRRHIVPSIMPPFLVSLGLTAGNIVLLEASLSFLGIGPANQPSWGGMLAEARGAALLGESWHLAVFPGLAVVLCMLVFNVLSQSLERAINPRR